MLVIKVSILYLFLYAAAFSGVMYTKFNNPAIAFFVPSIFAMCVLAKIKLSEPKADGFKLALYCGMTFSLLSVVLTWLIQVQTGWIKHSPQLMYFMAFVGNFLFPFMIFPKIKNAQQL